MDTKLVGPVDDDGSNPYGEDIFLEPEGDPNTLANLGPLTAMAGIWEGAIGVDQHPVAEGAESEIYIEHYELQPIDRQTNGPQLFYGLRYHTHIVKPIEVETFHDQVGYWLWEPATSLVTFTLAIPRGQVLLASAHADADATEFSVRSEIGSENYGILSNPFLDRAFRTISFVMTVSTGPEGTWSYEQETLLVMPGVGDPFSHTDHNTLTRTAMPTPNPMALDSSNGAQSKDPR